jgi:hypothetical protein
MCLLIALLTAFCHPVQSQVLAIFEQGAEELKEYGQQIAALELLLTGQQKGYQIIESGLSSIGSITGDEYSLHQNYYGSLGAVNPAIAQTSQIAECLSVESTMLTALSTAIQRWRSSKYLTTGDLSYINQMTEILTNAASTQLKCLRLLVADDGLMMTDNERIQQVNTVYQQLTSIISLSRVFISSTDILVLNREH